MGRMTRYADGHAETGDGIFWVESSRSASDEFDLLWRDAPDDDSTAGYREGGPGRYRLVEKVAGLRCDGHVERPNDGHVANNGTFILADWLFGDGLRSRIHVFSADGTELIRRECLANVLETYIEAEGRYAAAHLASNPEDEPDGERFILFDLKKRTEVWSKQLETGRPELVEFDLRAGALWLTNQPFGRVRFELADGAVDALVLKDRLLMNGDGFAILELVESEIQDGVADSRREVLLEACLRASPKLSRYPKHAARAFRLAGDIVVPADPARTLAYWDRALELDPHVGVAKRAEALRSSLQ
jgi:hypothetical protein